MRGLPVFVCVYSRARRVSVRGYSHGMSLYLPISLHHLRAACVSSLFTHRHNKLCLMNTEANIPRWADNEATSSRICLQLLAGGDGGDSRSVAGGTRIWRESRGFSVHRGRPSRWMPTRPPCSYYTHGKLRQSGRLFAIAALSRDNLYLPNTI